LNAEGAEDLTTSVERRERQGHRKAEQKKSIPKINKQKPDIDQDR
jgi:hypothetical protein